MCVSVSMGVCVDMGVILVSQGSHLDRSLCVCPVGRVAGQGLLIEKVLQREREGERGIV